MPPVMATAAVCSASDPLYPRRWVAAPGASNNGAPLRVVQFNILADGLSARHPSNGGFTESPPESLAWDFRRDRLVVENLERDGRSKLKLVLKGDDIAKWAAALERALPQNFSDSGDESPVVDLDRHPN